MEQQQCRVTGSDFRALEGAEDGSERVVCCACSTVLRISGPPFHTSRGGAQGGAGAGAEARWSWHFAPIAFYPTDPRRKFCRLWVLDPKRAQALKCPTGRIFFGHANPAMHTRTRPSRPHALPHRPHPLTHQAHAHVLAMPTTGCLLASFSLPPVAPGQQDRRKPSTASLRTGTRSLLPHGVPLVDAVRPTHPATGIARWRGRRDRGHPAGPRVMAGPGSDSPRRLE